MQHVQLCNETEALNLLQWLPSSSSVPEFAEPTLVVTHSQSDNFVYQFNFIYLLSAKLLWDIDSSNYYHKTEQRQL